jgi:hypothetical protein
MVCLQLLNPLRYQGFQLLQNGLEVSKSRCILEICQEHPSLILIQKYTVTTSTNLRRIAIACHIAVSDAFRGIVRKKISPVTLANHEISNFTSEINIFVDVYSKL